jgi:hypothetical protein
VMQSRTKISIAIGALLVAATATAIVKPELLPFTSGKVGTAQAVLATVNQQTITAADVEPMMANGMAKAVAIENAVNRTLTAEAAMRQWPADAQALSDSVAREALAGLYVRKKYAEIHKAIPDADIARYYASNVTDEMYSGHVVKYYLTQDAKDASEMAEAAKQGAAASLAKFTWVNKEGDHSVLPAGVPYNLYQQVRTMQAGQITGPYRVRDGLLFLRLEERKPGKRPDLPKVSDEIRGLIAQQRLEASLKELREQAKIQLK